MREPMKMGFILILNLKYKLMRLLTTPQIPLIIIKIILKKNRFKWTKITLFLQMLTPMKGIIKKMLQTQLITQAGDKTMTAELRSMFMITVLIIAMDGETLITTIGAGTMGGH